MKLVSPFRSAMERLPADYTAMDVYRALVAANLPCTATLPRLKRLSALTQRRLQTGHRFGWKCCDCGEHCDIEHGTIDHHVPKSRNGSNRPANLRWMCEPCNRKKANAMPKAGVVNDCFKTPTPVITLMLKPTRHFRDLFDYGSRRG